MKVSPERHWSVGRGEERGMGRFGSTLNEPRDDTRPASGPVSLSERGPYFSPGSRPERCESPMCRNIKTLYNFEPPVTDEEIRAASLQFVRKLSGFTRPSQANEAAFERAVDETAEVARRLLDSLVTTAPPRDRDVEAAKARARAEARFGGR